jgi:hypothetical protein
MAPSPEAQLAVVTMQRSSVSKPGSGRFWREMNLLLDQAGLCRALSMLMTCFAPVISRRSLRCHEPVCTIAG